MDSVIDIDDSQLDVEWLKQPKKMLLAGRKLADARLKFNEAKAMLDLVEANLNLKCRQKPENFGLEKATDKAVEFAVVTHEDYQKAVRRMNKRKHEMDYVEALVTALHHRKGALEGRVQLLGMEFYAEPRESKHSRRASEKIAKNSRRGINLDDEDD